jgi:hypothetical protein
VTILAGLSVGSTPTHEDLVGIYINDHRGGAAAGLALARRILRNSEGTPLGETMRVITPQIQQDARTLDSIARRLGIAASHAKPMLARAGEALARLKPNGQLRGYSPLSRLLDIEALLAGSDARRSLWRALGSSETSGRLLDIDFENLAQRATEQRQRLIPHHAEAAQVAFGGHEQRTAATL